MGRALIVETSHAAGGRRGGKLSGWRSAGMCEGACLADVAIVEAL